jgi:hypothetical protein
MDWLDGIEDGWFVQFKVVTLLVLGFSLIDRDWVHDNSEFPVWLGPRVRVTTGTLR